MSKIYGLVYEKISAKPGFLLFGFVILDCDVVVYLDICDMLLSKRCEIRGDVDFIDELFVKEFVKKDWHTHKDITKKVLSTSYH